MVTARIKRAANHKRTRELDFRMIKGFGWKGLPLRICTVDVEEWQVGSLFQVEGITNTRTIVDYCYPVESTWVVVTTDSAAVTWVIDCIRCDYFFGTRRERAKDSSSKQEQSCKVLGKYLFHGIRICRRAWCPWMKVRIDWIRTHCLWCVRCIDPPQHTTCIGWWCQGSQDGKRIQALDSGRYMLVTGSLVLLDKSVH